MSAEPDKPSLNRMVLDVMQALRDERQLDFITARQVRDQIEEVYDIAYPIQTIIVVLNRFASKGEVKRRTFAGKEVRQRYAYYLSSGKNALQEQQLLERLKALADEFFNGNLEETAKAARLLADKETLVFHKD